MSERVVATAVVGFSFCFLFLLVVTVAECAHAGSVGADGREGRFSCSSCSRSDKMSRPQCSMMKSEIWTMCPLLLSRRGCCPYLTQAKQTWSLACTQVSSWKMG